MPFALVVIGLLMIVTGARDTQEAFALQLKTDFTGPAQTNFITWLIALGMIGALGYIKPLAPFSKAFLTLVIIVMILAQQKNGSGGFFAALQSAIATGPKPAASAAPNQTPAAPPVQAQGNTVPDAKNFTMNGTDYTKVSPFGGAFQMTIPSSWAASFQSLTNPMNWIGAIF